MLTPLKTLKGSRIWYAKGGIGKKVGNKIYVHKDYALDVIPTDEWWYAQDVLHEYDPDFKYNCVCYDTKSHVIRFDEAPDFDTAREPHPGKMVSINVSTFDQAMKLKYSYSYQIWHHKWLWVVEDYDGFDIQASYNWSKTWLQYITSPSGYLHKWNEELRAHGLPVDNV